jgi:hypothetical protein
LFFLLDEPFEKCAGRDMKKQIFLIAVKSEALLRDQLSNCECFVHFVEDARSVSEDMIGEDIDLAAKKFLDAKHGGETFIGFSAWQ